MKRFLLKKTERFRLLAALLVTVCGFATARALESDDINAAILVDGSVPVRWTNDAAHPWYIAEDSNGSYMRTPEKDDDRSVTSTLTFTYTSSYPTEISFLWRMRSYRGGDLSVSIDGEEVGTISSGFDWYAIINTQSYSDVLMVPSGSHTVQITSTSNNDNNYEDDYFSGLRNLRVWECKELESACLKDGSLPLTFENETDLDKMWITESGYIHTAALIGDDTTKISTTFTIDKPSVFSYELRIEGFRNGASRTIVHVDGMSYEKLSNTSDYDYNSIVLYPGTHKVEFECRPWNGDSQYLVELRNVCLDQSWYNVRLNAPGELRTRLLQALSGKNFQDAELVKITGSMNEDDWSIIKQLTNVKAIDFTDTDISEIPNEACRGLAHLSTVMLPETLVNIGDYAFYKTHFYSLTIPANVERIGRDILSNTILRYIDFADDSKLKYIGYAAFYGTNITEFIMPDSVELCDSEYIFLEGYKSSLVYGCKYLKKLHLSNGLSCVPSNIANDCTSLEEVDIPEKATSIESYAFANTALKSIRIPKDVKTIGGGAFMNCDSLKNITLNSLCWDMDNTFSYSEAIESIVLPCATPPSIIGDPFAGVDKDKVRLVVPDFAFDTYRSDPYWYQFSRNTFADEEASLNDYWGIRGDLLLDVNHVMQGTPSLEVYTGGSITFDSDTPQEFDEVIFNTSESTPASLLSKSNAVKANSLVTKFHVEEANKWYFFSPLADVRMSEVTYSSTDSWIIHYYDGAHRASENSTSGNWINVPADGILKRGQGYIIQALEAGWLTLPAIATETDKFFGNDEVTIALEDYDCETPENAGWNFVANPYPCYYDIYYLGMEAPLTIWDGRTYRAYSLSDGDRGDNTLVLRPMQPFFVQKASPDLSARMTLEGRRTSNVIDRTRTPRVTTADVDRCKLNLELYCNDNEEADDYTRVVLNENASMEYEAVRDASKFMSMNPDVAQLYTLGGNGIPMAINERPYDDGNVALGVLLPAIGNSYRIAAARADRRVWIYDSVTGIEQDLTEGDYMFTASKTGADNKRFSLRFAPSANAVEWIGNKDVKVTGDVGSIVVTAPTGSTVAVYATDGSMIANATTANDILCIPTAGGVYVVKVNGETFKTIVK